MSVVRAAENPLISPLDVTPSLDGFEVIGVFNAGVARFGDEVVLLLRVAERPIQDDPAAVTTALYDASQERIVTIAFDRDDPANDFSDPRLIVRPGETYLTSISHLRAARSSDGIRFEIDDDCALAAANEYEMFGLEDPRITCIEGIYHVNYVAVSPLGVTTCLASSIDLVSFGRHGVIFCPENKDVAIFPEMISGKYYALHRPNSALFGRNEMWIAESPDLMCWGNHRHLLGRIEGRWDEQKIGAGAVPVLIDQGWLEVYHGADRENRYSLGALLLDRYEPWKVIARSETPILEPQMDYEMDGFFGGVVFTCGLLCEDNMVKIYYGAADTSICYAEVPLVDVLANLRL